jgi:hypothetical protein
LLNNDDHNKVLVNFLKRNFDDLKKHGVHCDQLALNGQDRTSTLSQIDPKSGLDYYDLCSLHRIINITLSSLKTTKKPEVIQKLIGLLNAESDVEFKAVCHMNTGYGWRTPATLKDYKDIVEKNKSNDARFDSADRNTTGSIRNNNSPTVQKIDTKTLSLIDHLNKFIQGDRIKNNEELQEFKNAVGKYFKSIEQTDYSSQLDNLKSNNGYRKWYGVLSKAFKEEVDNVLFSRNPEKSNQFAFEAKKNEVSNNGLNNSRTSNLSA